MSNEYLVGQKILGYELEELIGSGGFGKVYKGVKKVGKDEYYAAIKHISLPKNNEYNDLLNSMGRNYEAVDKYYEKILDDMVNEINTLFYLSKKDNKNIVTYYDHDIVKQENPLKYDIFIRMEYLKPLNIYSNEGNMTIEDAINLGIDIARALDNCHKQGIIHRDVKDGNIFISEDGYFKLGDFGISRMLSDTNQTLSMKGTPIFMAPEVILGKYYDKTVDIYSLGIVLYRLLNYNRIPFLPKYPEIYTSRDTDIAMNRRLSGEKFDNPQNASDELGKVILKACDVQGSRYDSCEEFINDLLKVKGEMDKTKLSKFLFEVDSKDNSNESCHLDDTHILTQNNLDDTVLLESSLEGYVDETEYINTDSTYEKCIDNSIDDTVILESSNEDDLYINKAINDIDDTYILTQNNLDDTVLLESSLEGYVDEKEYIKNDNTYEEYIDNRIDDTAKESITNFNTTEDIKRKKSNLKNIIIAISISLLFGFAWLDLKNNEPIENEERARIEQLKANLPKSSSKLGCLPGNLVTFGGDASTPSDIVTLNNIAFLNNGGELGTYDKSLEEPFTILTNTDGELSPYSFNKYGDYIYFRGGDGESCFKVQKYNTITNEISDVYGIHARQMIIMGDYMYYIEEKHSNNDTMEENSHLFKMNLIDGSKEKILNISIEIFSINSNYLLYRKALTDDDSIYLMNLETKETVALDIENDLGIAASWVALYENCILYIDEKDKSLYRVNLNGNDIDITSKEKIQENVSDFTLEGQYLYFIEGNANIEEGSSKLLVKDLLSNDTYYITDDALDINVDGGIMKYSSTDGYFYADKFLPERYEKVYE